MSGYIYYRENQQGGISQGNIPMTHERGIIHTHIYVIYVRERRTTERRNELENNPESHYLTIRKDTQLF